MTVNLNKLTSSQVYDLINEIPSNSGAFPGDEEFDEWENPDDSSDLDSSRDLPSTTFINKKWRKTLFIPTLKQFDEYLDPIGTDNLERPAECFLGLF
ncbi:hypothetical protein ILUMI_01804, partial [Ignelater luminosus]